MTKQQMVARREVLIGAAILAILPILVVAIFSGNVSKLFRSEPTRVVRATFADAQQVRSGSYVRIDGVNLGRVDRVDLNPDNRTSTVTMKLEESAGDLYENATATLRFRTVLGGVFVVDLERGSPDRPALGDTPIAVSRTARQVEVDDITAAFKGSASTGLTTLPRELADALRDPAVPDRLFDTAADASPGIADGLNALRGRDQDRDLQRLVANTADTVRALDTPREDIRTVIQGVAATLQTTAVRGDDIRSVLRMAEPANVEINATLNRLRTTLDVVDPLISKLERPADDVAPTFARLRPVLVNASGLLDRAVPLLRALRPTASSLAATARGGRALLNDLTPSINRTDQTILPMLSEIDAGTQKSTAVMIGGTFAGLGSGAGGQMDANGHFIRFPGTSGSSPVNSLPCQVYINNPDSAQLAACGELSEALSAYLNYNPLGPVPGSVEPPPPAKKERKK